MKLSIIVPIYNVAPYLRRCVDSLLTQDISDYEIILVDDGSTDNSGVIADELTAYPQPLPKGKGVSMRVIHQENAGLSAARNTGIAVAQGEYIMFVDSDDYLHSNVLRTLMEQIERDNLDVLRFRYQNVKENGETFVPHKGMKVDYNDFSCIPTDGVTFLNERMWIQCYAWQFVVKKNIIEQELFTPGIYFEDTDWTPRILLKANGVASTDRVVYNYLWREGSITLTGNKEKLRKQLRDKLMIVEKLNVLGKSISNRQWFDTMISSLMIGIINLLATILYEERMDYVKQIQSLKIFPLTTFHIPTKAKEKIKLMNLSINLSLLLTRIRQKFLSK